jgi:ribosome biogenesis protein ERB1
MPSKRREAAAAESSEEEEDQQPDEQGFGVEDVEPDSDDYDSGSEGASSSSADESEEEFSSDGEDDGEDDKASNASSGGAHGHESDYSSSEDERMVNTVGDVPMEWYEHEEHIGYDREGKKILRKTSKQDRIDSWLSGNDDKSGWRTVYDEVNDEKVKLTPSEVEILTRVADGKFPHSDFDQYAPMMRMKQHVAGGIHPLYNATEPKARFVPSKWEAKAVIKIVRAMRRGDIKPPETEAEREAKERQGFLLWGDDDRAEDPEDMSKAARARKLMQVSAPKVAPPGHAESYNPPAEYLPSEEEVMAWKDLAPEDRPYNFEPTGFGSMRQVPAYGRFVNERFERCLDLYLCPRTKRTRLNIDPESLVPKLPKPSELRPFPTEISVVFKGHDARIRSISVDPSGQWLASASDDKTVRLWEVETGRQMGQWTVEDAVECVAFNPNPEFLLLAFAVGTRVGLLIPGKGVGNEQVRKRTLAVVQPFAEVAKVADGEKGPAATWESAAKSEWSKEEERGVVCSVRHSKRVSHIAWHRKGDYFATCMSKAVANAVLIHRLVRQLAHRSTLSLAIDFCKRSCCRSRVRLHVTLKLFACLCVWLCPYGYATAGSKADDEPVQADKGHAEPRRVPS